MPHLVVNPGAHTVLYWYVVLLKLLLGIAVAAVVCKLGESPVSVPEPLGRKRSIVLYAALFGLLSRDEFVRNLFGPPLVAGQFDVEAIPFALLALLPFLFYVLCYAVLALAIQRAFLIVYQWGTSLPHA